MSNIEVKTADLIGPALDWAVALATGADELKVGADGGVSCIYQLPDGGCWTNYYRPSTDWSQGGPLIEKHITALNQSGTETWWAHSEDRLGLGPTALIAACRAIVAAKLGDTVSVPAELAQP
ncbi:DUF2591 domain-containing protein [Pseudomonas cavernicola]|uniref:DUF2591 domain-containing protein n=1 Tax=Pseudomonas cavernicola TaxID=2320866 RepID=A0A418XEZ0_9PSED|nr:phage protein NinX family protein [Pseudomonas cavernicola]RJG10967.1 DUF2591 domain-containing protein [Pseudomonas cavernicola]